jgi:hypothetical protein
MKFKVRDSFAVHIERIIERNEGGRKVRDAKTDSHFAGDLIDIDEAEARKHLHKLEPFDADARALLEGEYEKGRQIAANRIAGGDATIVERVDAAVAAALKAHGITAAPAAGARR